MKGNKLLKMVYAALFAALVFVGTQFIRVPLPFGYFNFGDCFVILSALIVGGPYAVIASAIGAALADVLSGYAVYAPVTLIIKAVMVVAMIMISQIGAKMNKKHKLLFCLLGGIAAELIMVGGYFAYDSVLYTIAGAIAALPGSIMQGAVAVAASMTIITMFERSGLNKYIKLQ